MSDDPPSSSKPELRMAALARRAALGDQHRAAAARAIAAAPFPVDITPGIIVAGYHPIRSEIDPQPLMRALQARSARLALPAIVARDAPLLFRSWNPDDALIDGRGDVLISGMFGIPEPRSDAPEVLPDILLVPLAAFDVAGHRIGYGAGHYDRTFAKLRAAQKSFTAIGVAFETQLVEAVPMQPHDVALDFVLTEVRTFGFRST